MHYATCDFFDHLLRMLLLTLYHSHAARNNYYQSKKLRSRTIVISAIYEHEYTEGYGEDGE